MLTMLTGSQTTWNKSK